MESAEHWLSLKVMRLSRPTLASAWQPFFTSSPSFSSHATEALLPLQGKEPLPGHPKTLRDLTHASQLLTLPSAFGAIQLGETFTSCLCLNNEAAIEVEGVTLRIEMQTATSKVLLAEVGGPNQKLNAADVLEAIVSHEMKELGQHVLGCYVSYRPPQSGRTPLAVEGDSADPNLQSFRKYYKFVVTNPLTVKTKVHVPRSPTALLSRTEREKVFLEIHVQNVTQEPMWFERMRFECVDGWEVADGNISQKDGKDLFSSALALMQPQDVRQYVYILTPTSIPSFPVVHTPGTIIPLGRLDLAWRSPFGEPGRLLTSLLTRRIPIPHTPAAPSAIPSHLQQPRPPSPQKALARPTSPPISAHSVKPRLPFPQAGRPQSPASFAPLPTPPPAPSDLQVDLVVRSLPRSDICLDRPFKATFELTLSGLLPDPGKTRLVHLAVQHIQPPRSQLPSGRSMTSDTVTTFSPRPPTDALSPKVHGTRALRRDTDVVDGGLPGALDDLSNTVSPLNTNHIVSSHFTKSPMTLPRSPISKLPSPFSPSIKPQSVLYLGASLLFLPPVELQRPPPTTPTTTDTNPEGAGVNPRGQTVQDFECTFIPIRKGLAQLGGLRLLVVEDREIEAARIGDPILMSHADAEAKVLREWDAVGEVLVMN